MTMASQVQKSKRTPNAPLPTDIIVIKELKTQFRYIITDFYIQNQKIDKNNICVVENKIMSGNRCMRGKIAPSMYVLTNSERGECSLNS